ncbi:Pentatricopeptide repeat-containing protein [Acorus calamus]|uniref:Pentatricopeptide repeat-containing protein n=1 Tax=Acorus calamus TaxID=4465 RepID=A0AAV9CI36_ACOCL|nr:Pentatricopeptide repeat-containing protein [Acorus calamus]
MTNQILFNRYTSARLPSDTIHAYERAASEFGLKGEPLFTSLVDTLCEHKHVIEAEELCFKRRDFPVYIETHNMILRKYAKLGWWRKCREFWVDFEKDIVIKSGKLCMAVKLLEEMIERGVHPDVVAYNTVIQTVGLMRLVKKGMSDMARRYDEKMVAKGFSERPRKELGTSILGGECCYEDHGVF